MRDRKIHEDLIKKGYSRIQEKIKKIRQYFSEAVISGFLKFFCCLQIRLAIMLPFFGQGRLLKFWSRNLIGTILAMY